MCKISTSLAFVNGLLCNASFQYKSGLNTHWPAEAESAIYFHWCIKKKKIFITEMQLSPALQPWPPHVCLKCLTQLFQTNLNI